MGKFGLKLNGQRSPWATLLRVAWLAIVLGLLLQSALLLVAVGFGASSGPGALLAETFRTVCWSLLVCVGVALGRIAAKGVLLEGVTGLLAAPLALTAANTLQKGVAEALSVAGATVGPTPLWVLAIKAAEYACLGVMLGWIGRRGWGSALGHMAAGLVTGVVFGGAFLTIIIQSSPTPPTPPSLLARGINELLFPIGCALVGFIAEVLGRRVTPLQQTIGLPGDVRHGTALRGRQGRHPPWAEAAGPLPPSRSRLSISQSSEGWSTGAESTAPPPGWRIWRSSCCSGRIPPA